MNTEQTQKEQLTLEEAFEKLDQILARLADREVSLDQSFTAYTEGMQLLKYCNEHLDKVEKKMMILNEEGGLDEF